MIGGSVGILWLNCGYSGTIEDVVAQLGMCEDVVHFVTMEILYT
jgi:hypothetical protein